MVPLLQPHSSSSGDISDTSFLPDSRLSSGLLCSSLPVGPPLFPSDDSFHLPSTYPVPGSVLNSLLRVHVQPYLGKTIMSPFYRWENGGTKMLTCSRSLSKKILTFSAYFPLIFESLLVAGEKRCQCWWAFWLVASPSEMVRASVYIDPCCVSSVFGWGWGMGFGCFMFPLYSLPTGAPGPLYLKSSPSSSEWGPVCQIVPNLSTSFVGCIKNIQAGTPLQTFCTKSLVGRPIACLSKRLPSNSFKFENCCWKPSWDVYKMMFWLNDPLTV